MPIQDAKKPKSGFQVKRAFIGFGVVFLICQIVGCSGGITPPISSLTAPAAQETTPTFTMPTNTMQPDWTPTLTPTPAPTQTELPTETATLTTTPIPEKLGGFCLPVSFAGYIVSAEDVKSPPQGAIEIKEAGGTASLRIPAASCTLVFTFSYPMSEAVLLELFENPSDPVPWFTGRLEPLPDDPHTAYITLTHEYVINAPFWEVIYPFQVLAAGGEAGSPPKWNGQIRVFRPFPGLCWEGSVPDPLTLACPKTDPLEREPHPDVTMPPPH